MTIFAATFDDTPSNGLNTVWIERGGARIYHVGGRELPPSVKRRIRADGVRVRSEHCSNERGTEIAAMLDAGKQPLQVRDFHGAHTYRGKRVRSCVGWHVEEAK